MGLVYHQYLVAQQHNVYICKYARTTDRAIIMLKILSRFTYKKTNSFFDL